MKLPTDAKNTRPNEEKLCGLIEPLKNVLGLPLVTAQYFLSFITLAEGLILGLYYGEGLYLISWNVIVFLAIFISAKTLNESYSLYAFYGFCVNLALHGLAVFMVGSKCMFGGSNSDGDTPTLTKWLFYYLTLATLLCFSGLLITYSFYARIRRGQIPLVRGEKQDALADQP